MHPYLHPKSGDQVWKDWKPQARSRRPVSPEHPLEVRLRNGAYLHVAPYAAARWDTLPREFHGNEIVAWRHCSKAEHEASEKARAEAKRVVEQGVKLFTPYSGGPRPVAASTMIFVKTRNGHVTPAPRPASEFDWCNPCFMPNDIVGYRVATPAELEPPKAPLAATASTATPVSLLPRDALDRVLLDVMSLADVKRPALWPTPPAAGKPSNPKDVVGATKVPLSLCSPIAKAHWAAAQHSGLAKYGAWNWRAVGVRASVYLDAAQRHLDAYLSGETHDPIDGTHHLGNVMACAAILLDAEAAGKLSDDRPPSVGLRQAYLAVEDMLKQHKAKYRSPASPKVRDYTIADTKAIARGDL